MLRKNYKFDQRLRIISAILLLAGAIPLVGQAQLPAPLPVSEHSRPAEQNWWKNGVIYEIYPRSFQDSNGDGIGDLNGITSRLDYLKELGVDGIWLTPCYPSPQVDFGYDISDYKNIDPQYGTLADFDRLVSEAAKRHIRVIMDMVMNHTSDQHEWFLQSRSSRNNPYRDWYVWRDPKGYDAAGKPIPPNNWLSGFGHSAWEWDAKTKQFYYHKFYAQQPDVNWDNPLIHKAFKEVMEFWLKRGVAGFRFDAITTLYEDPSMADEPFVRNQNGEIRINAYGDQQTDGTKTDNLPGLHAVMQEMRAASDKFNAESFPGTRVLIGETYVRTVQDLAAMYGSDRKPEFHLPMDTQLAFINKLDVARFREKLVQVETGIGANTPLLLFDNHDQRRMEARYGDGVHDTEIQRMLSTVLFLSRGASLFYYGDEIGMKTTPPVRKEDVKDPIGIIGWPREKGRDGERTPMQWDASQQAGFSKAVPWLPVPPSSTAINVEFEQKDPNSLLNWYKELIHLKKTVPALQDGANEMLDPTNTAVLSWVLKAPGAQPVVVAANFTGQQQTVDLSGVGPGQVHLHTLLMSPGSKAPASLQNVELVPFGVYIAELQ